MNINIFDVTLNKQDCEYNAYTYIENIGYVFVRIIGKAFTNYNKLCKNITLKKFNLIFNDKVKMINIYELEENNIIWLDTIKY